MSRQHFPDDSRPLILGFRMTAISLLFQFRTSAAVCSYTPGKVLIEKSRDRAADGLGKNQRDKCEVITVSGELLSPLCGQTSM